MRVVWYGMRIIGEWIQRAKSSIHKTQPAKNTHPPPDRIVPQRGRRLAERHGAGKRVNVGGHCDWHAQIVREEGLRGDLADAGAGALALHRLQIPAALDLDGALPYLRLPAVGLCGVVWCIVLGQSG